MRLAQVAVVALSDDRDKHLLGSGGDGNVHRTVVDPPDCQGRGQVHRSLEQAPFADRCEPVSSPAPFSTAMPAGSGSTWDNDGDAGRATTGSLRQTVT